MGTRYTELGFEWVGGYSGDASPPPPILYSYVYIFKKMHGVHSFLLHFSSGRSILLGGTFPFFRRFLNPCMFYLFLLNILLIFGGLVLKCLVLYYVLNIFRV